MTEQEVQDGLRTFLEEYSWSDADDRFGAEEIGDLLGFYPEGIRTYDDAGILTMNKGLVIEMPDGSEFQITIVKSR